MTDSESTTGQHFPIERLEDSKLSLPCCYFKLASSASCKTAHSNDTRTFSLLRHHFVGERSFICHCSFQQKTFPFYKLWGDWYLVHKWTKCPLMFWHSSKLFKKQKDTPFILERKKNILHLTLHCSNFAKNDCYTSPLCLTNAIILSLLLLLHTSLAEVNKVIF